jgi:hypothetical protein
MGRVSRFAYNTLQVVVVPLENKLEAKGRWKSAQFLRLLGDHMLCARHSDDYIIWLQNLIDFDIMLRRIVQHEVLVINLSEEIKATLEDPKTNHQELEKIRTDLLWLEECYWDIERRIYLNHCSRPRKGPVSRAYESVLSSPQWYLQPWLIQDCRGRGGCCGRDCGCCFKPRSSVRNTGDGHCTSKCGCCLQARGFAILNKDQSTLCQPPINVKAGLAGEHHYSLCMIQAYLFCHVPRR